MTSYPALSTLAPPAYHHEPTSGTLRLEEAEALAFVQALQDDFGIATGSEEFIKLKIHELAATLATKIPSEYWFSSRGVTNGKLFFNQMTGFSLFLQSATKERHTQAAEVNTLLTTVGYAR